MGYQWIGTDERQPKKGDLCVVLFRNGGTKLFTVETVPLHKHIIAWFKVPDIPKEVEERQASLAMERLLNGYFRHELLNTDFYNTDTAVDDMDFIIKYLKKKKNGFEEEEQ